MKPQQLRTGRFVLMTLAFALVACIAPAMAADIDVKFKEVTFTDSSTPSFGAPCPLAPGTFDRVDVGTVEGELQGTITACLKFTFTPGGVPQASGPFEIATADVTWTGNFLAFATSGFLATGEFFGDGTDGSMLRGNFSQFQIGDPLQGVPDRFLDRAIIITPHSN